MAKLSKAPAARQLGIARATLYKLIAQGKVSPAPDGLIDQAELVRVAPYIDTLHERTRTSTDCRVRLQTSTDTKPPSPQISGDIHASYLTENAYERPQTGVSRHLQTDVSERLQTSTDTLVDILREQLRLMQEREREHTRLAEAREQAYREHIAQLTIMLHEAHQQNQRLLDMPCSSPAPPPQGGQPPRHTQSGPTAPRPPQEHAGDPRGAMRRRIVALLQDHPEGLTPAQMQTLLGVERSLADTCLGMLRYGLVQRVGRGRYVAAEPTSLHPPAERHP
jgi:hypothetical protein